MLFKRSIALSLVGFIAVICCAGCRWQTTREFRPMAEENPMIMFDQYRLDIHGYASGLHNIECDVYTVDSVPATTNIDSIPIFTIDSMCFTGSCLDSQLCCSPESHSEAAERLYRLGLNGYSEPDTDPGKDLRFRSGRIEHEGFSLSGVLKLPDSCKGQDVIVEIRARLVNRITGETIAAERKRVQFYIDKRKTRMLFMS